MSKQDKQNFFDQVYAVVKRIPYGKVVSYGQIAKLLGSPKAARQVGWALSTCPEELPWQRVVMADGSVTGGEWEEVRRNLLAEEGVEFLLDGRVDMENFRWDPKPDELLDLEDLLASHDLDADEALKAEIAFEIATLEVQD